MKNRAERRYAAALLKYTRSLISLIASKLDPVLSELEKEEEIKTDSSEDDILRVLASIELPDLDIDLGEVVSRVSQENSRELTDVLGINPGDTVPQRTMNQFVRENTDLIKTIPRRLLGDITNVVRDSIAQGVNPDKLRKIIQSRYDVAPHIAERIARDQAGKLNAQINQERQQSLGITSYIWMTANDERVRGRKKTKKGKISGDGRHWQLHGTTHRWDNPPVVDKKGRRSHPGEQIQCRCIAQPIVDLDTLFSGEEDRETEQEPQRQTRISPLQAGPPRVSPRPPRAASRPPRAASRPTRAPRPTATPRQPSLLAVQVIRVRNMLRSGMTPLQVARRLDLPFNQVRDIARRIGIT